MPHTQHILNLMSEKAEKKMEGNNCGKEKREQRLENCRYPNEKLEMSLFPHRIFLANKSVVNSRSREYLPPRNDVSQAKISVDWIWTSKSDKKNSSVVNFSRRAGFLVRAHWSKIVFLKVIPPWASCTTQSCQLIVNWLISCVNLIR